MASRRTSRHPAGHPRSSPDARGAELPRQGDYLSACFPDFRLNPPIGGTIKNFKPDCGIASVGAAIEFKLAHTKQQAIVSFTSVVEDTDGLDVPFEFHMGPSILPAGEYTVYTDGSTGLVRMRSADSESSAMIQTNCVQSCSTPEVGKLVFHR